jgi:hypothetical protein
MKALKARQFFEDVRKLHSPDAPEMIGEAIDDAVKALAPWPTSRCECKLCKRGREYYRITERLPADEQKWMREFYDAVLDTETELSMERAS